MCTETNSTGYYIKCEGSVDGAVSDGCDAIALRVRPLNAIGNAALIANYKVRLISDRHFESLV